MSGDDDDVMITSAHQWKVQTDEIFGWCVSAELRGADGASSGYDA